MYLPRGCSIVVEYILSTHCIVGNALCMLANPLCTVYCRLGNFHVKIRLKNYIAGYNVVAVRSSRQLGIYLGRCGDVCASLFVDHRHVSVFIRMLNLRGWSQARNYFNSKIFPIYMYSSRKFSKVQILQICLQTLKKKAFIFVE